MFARWSFFLHLEAYYEERIARYLELAEAAQEAAGRASTTSLQETYAQLAGQWVHLAEMAGRTIDLAQKVSACAPGDAGEEKNGTSG